MPKYYRFRATTPTRRIKRCKGKDKDLEQHKPQTIDNWLDLSCSSVQSWYLRRTWWREPISPDLPKQTWWREPVSPDLPKQLVSLRVNMLTSNRHGFFILPSGL
ncbi:hypothetical protein JYU34_010160 [Plutella xylostella]|uniref:Uncharacterized protein n=1 Tax=Plutella xylostella TaxID=51655 RepID=A0ABQ7QHX4_PLUXY|nr:hypothetical protein JYU34_010160 [Plutella xylostella]